MDDIGIMAGQEEGTTSFLQKPFTPEVLASSVRNLLDARMPSDKAGDPPSTSKPTLR
jgi:DNA-binding response OmpR family regulator